MNQEKGKCSFCGEIKPVSRQYLNAKNTKHIDTNKHTPFTITFYCNDCDIEEKMLKEMFNDFRNDKSEGSWYYGWQANIAMAMFDELNGKITKEEANAGAKRFLELLIK